MGTIATEHLVKCACNSVWNVSMWFICCGAEFTDLYLGIFGIQSWLVSLHPAVYSVFPPMNHLKRNWGQCFWHVLLEAACQKYSHCYNNIQSLLCDQSFPPSQLINMVEHHQSLDLSAHIDLLWRILKRQRYCIISFNSTALCDSDIKTHFDMLTQEHVTCDSE